MSFIRYIVIFVAIAAPLAAADVVSFQSGKAVVHGVLYKPTGAGPFRAVLYNHGSALDSSAASDALGPIFASHGWLFFMPHRRGQGLSSSAGPYIRDEITAAHKTGGISAAASTMIRLLETDHLSDQLAALDWLRSRDYVKPNQIAVIGNSFGGIETLLGAERGSYCAAVDLSGGAESWAQAPGLQTIMSRAARNSRAPIFFIQPENDFDLSPTRVLSAVMKDAGKPFEVKIYPAFGKSAEEGHSFTYRGASIWAEDVLGFLDRHCPNDRIGDIEFFGYKGLDLKKIRETLPVHEGDEYSDRTKQVVRRAVADATGKEPTDVAVICCDEKRNHLLFIGLPGASYKTFVYNPEPKGKERLSSDIINLYSRLDHALEAAVRRGGQAAEEDYSSGYALIKDPDARSLQLAVRNWAVKHESELFRVLEFSSAVQHRRVASDALGYVRQSRRQILALVRSSRDVDDEVRNNATRSLGVLVRSNTRLASNIPTETFIEILNSGKWTDRNKGAALLEQLTATRNSELLGAIRSDAIDSLVEMAAWRRPSHAFFARMVLGRAAGLPENRLRDLAWNGPVDAIIEAAGRR